MPVSYAPAMDILPEMLLAGILAFIFYLNFRKLKVKAVTRTEFILVRGDSTDMDLSKADRNEMSTPLYETNTFLKETLLSSHMVFLTVTLWIGLAMVMIPVSKLYLIFPRFGFYVTLLVYGLLAVVISLSLISTVVSRISITKLNLAILLAAGGVAVFISFYLPFMSWASSYGQLMHMVFIYCAVALAVFGIYFVSTIMKERNTVRMAAIGSYIAYFSTSALLALNLFSNVF
jgi:hypothetical protein